MIFNVLLIEKPAFENYAKFSKKRLKMIVDHFVKIYLRKMLFIAR